LAELGLELIILPPEDDMPDSCFVEDTAIIDGKKAILTRPALEARRKEVSSIQDVISEYFEIFHIAEPATLEGGDVFLTLKEVVCGVTKRTNMKGASCLARILNRLLIGIEDSSIVHLKSYVTYLGDSKLIATKEYANNPAFEKFEILQVSEEEKYSANTLLINDTVLIPDNHPKTELMLRDNGFNVESINVSEFQKCEGALTCLSLIF